MTINDLASNFITVSQFAADLDVTRQRASVIVASAGIEHARLGSYVLVSKAAAAAYAKARKASS